MHQSKEIGNPYLQAYYVLHYERKSILRSNLFAEDRQDKFIRKKNEYTVLK